MKRLNVPGVAVGIYHKGKEVSAGFGVTSGRIPPSEPDTLFRRVDQQNFYRYIEMSLPSRASQSRRACRKYIKDLKLRDESVAKRVTVRNLLTHMGGGLVIISMIWDGDDALEKMVKDMQNCHGAPLERSGLITIPGSTWLHVYEIVTKKPYEQAAQEMLFDPLGLDMSFFIQVISCLRIDLWSVIK